MITQEDDECSPRVGKLSSEMSLQDVQVGDVLRYSVSLYCGCLGELTIS